MSALPRPDLPPGSHRDLVAALHDLHHRDGWRSLRALARETGVSHTTVSKAFSSTTLPSWGTLELLVEAMGGDTARLPRRRGSPPPRPPTGNAQPGRRGSPADARARRRTTPPRGRPRPAPGHRRGRDGEDHLARSGVRRGDRDLRRRRPVPAAVGRGPTPPRRRGADARSHDAEDGQLVQGGAGQRCPAYVRRGVDPPCSPSWSTDAPPTGTGRPVAAPAPVRRCRRAVLGRLADRRPFALALEDLHWADDLDPRPPRARPRRAGTRSPSSAPGAPRTTRPRPRASDWFARVRRSAMPSVLPARPSHPGRDRRAAPAPDPA